MINMLELKFINEFIVNEKKDRLIYEFSNPPKRENAIMRFSHKVENIVNDKFIQCRCNMGNLSNNLALSGDVYIVSLEKIYGETCPYKEALIHLNDQYMPVIIIGENTVIIKSENEDSKDKSMEEQTGDERIVPFSSLEDILQTSLCVPSKIVASFAKNEVYAEY